MNEYKKKYLIVIAGATAVGKTAVSIQFAKKLNTEIVSADAGDSCRIRCSTAGSSGFKTTRLERGFTRVVTGSERKE